MSENPTDDLATQIQRLTDREAIKELKAKYVRLVDGKQWDEWKELFTDDAVLNTEGGRHEGPEAIASSLARSIGQAGNTIHRVTMSEINFGGPDSATAIWGQQDVVSVIHQGKEIAFQGYGYYHEEYTRTPDGWKIRHSRLERRYTSDRGWQSNA